MIRRLLRVWPHEQELRALAARYAVAGALQGLLLLTLVPIVRALVAAQMGDVAAWLGVAAALGVLYLATLWWAKSAGYRAANRIMRDLQHGMGQRLYELPLGWFARRHSGQLARTVAQSAPTAAGTVSHVWPELIQAITTPAVVVAGVLLIDWRVGLAFLAIVPAAMLVLRWSGPVVRDTQAIMDEASSEAAGRAIEFAQAQPVLRGTGRALAGFAPMERALDEQRRTFRAALNRHTMPQLTFVGVIQAGYTLVLAVGATLAVMGTLPVADAVALLVLSARFVEPLAGVGNLFGTIRSADVAVDRVTEVLTAAPLPEGSAAPTASDVRFDGVRFSYAGAPVLRDLSLTMPAGTTTALVGRSGAGKTTMLRLIARYWDVDDGAVTIGGRDVRELSTGALMDHIAIVFQQTYLFTGTIEENVRLAAPDASAHALAKAAADSRLDQVVERLPAGWQTQVGEGGLALSGGERQRVAIARALLKGAPIVLLDEATAALDAENEAAVAAGLAALAAGGTTIIVIAHQLSTVMRADQIAVVEDGRIVELGRHAELVEREGRYARFWHERTRAAGWRISGAGPRP